MSARLAMDCTPGRGFSRADRGTRALRSSSRLLDGTVHEAPDHSPQAPQCHRALSLVPYALETMPVAVMVSFRLGGADGVSIEAKKWFDALVTLGWKVTTVAGGGPVDQLLPGLAIDAAEAPSQREVSDALADADLVIIENLCSLPLNRAGAHVVAGVCRGRPTLLHHHDLPWQRPQFVRDPPPPDD